MQIFVEGENHERDSYVFRAEASTGHRESKNSGAAITRGSSKCSKWKRVHLKAVLSANAKVYDMTEHLPIVVEIRRGNLKIHAFA
jgi:PII-like signaling protein